MDCSVLLLSIYTPLEARVLCNNCMSCLSIWATLSLLLINMSGFLPVVLHSDQPLSEGEIIPFSGVCLPVRGRLHYPPEAWWLHALTADCWCTTDDDQRRHHHQAQLWHYLLRVFCPSAATSRWRICMSVIAAFANFSSLAAFFVAGLCR